jgi:hypothetical protein
VTEHIQSRLDELRAEVVTGERRLAELRAEETGVRETLLRIDGAILALTQLLEVPGREAAVVE